MNNLQRVHQLRCRHAHEIQLRQQQQQEQQQQYQPQPQKQRHQQQRQQPQQHVSGCVPRIRNSLLDARVLRSTTQAAAADRHSQEAKEMLKSRLEKFFACLPTAPLPSRHIDHIEQVMDPKPRMRQPRVYTARRQDQIAEHLNTNSSVAMVSELPAAAWRGTCDDLTNTLAGSSCANSQDITEVSDITARDATGTYVSPVPSPPSPPLPAPNKIPRPQPIPQPSQQHQQQHQQHQSHDCLTQHHDSRTRSSSVLNLYDRVSQRRTNATSRVRPMPAPLQPITQAVDFAENMRHLLHDFKTATGVVSLHPTAAPLSQQQQQQSQQLQQRPPTAPSALPVPAPRRGRCDRREVRTSASAGTRVMPLVTPRSASTSSRAQEDRPVSHVFEIFDQETVRETLVGRNDRRVVKILAQYCCKAEVVDTAPLSGDRQAYVVVVDAPNFNHLLWCIGRIDCVFPSWKLKFQMRGYKVPSLELKPHVRTRKVS